MPPCLRPMQRQVQAMAQVIDRYQARTFSDAW